MSFTKTYASLLALSLASLAFPLTYTIGPVVIRPFDFSLIALVIYTAVASLVLTNAICFRIKKRVLNNEIITLVLVVYLSYTVLSGFVLTSAVVGIKELIQNLEMLLLFFAIIYVLERKDLFHYFFRYYLTLILCIVLYTISWHIINGHYLYYKDLNEAKLSFGILFLLSLVPLFQNITYKIKSKYIYLTLFSFIILLFSGERKALLAALASLLVISCYLYFIPFLNNFLKGSIKKSSTIFVSLLLFFVCFSFVIGIQITKVREQLVDIGSAVYSLTIISDITYQDIDSASNRNRLFLLSFTIDSIQNRPFFGYGTESFKQYSKKSAQNIPGVRGHGAHSEYQRMAVDNGLLGLALYVLLWFLLYNDIRKYRNLYKNNILSLWVFTLVFAIFGIVINLFLGGGIINRVFLIIPAAGIVALKNHRLCTHVRSNYCHT